MSLYDGAVFALDAPEHIPPVWGDGNEVLWAQGEPLMICGPQGVGKSTIGQQLMLARLGVLDLECLGQMVTPDPDRRVLYIAADRPSQIARSMRRMIGARHRRVLADGLMVWRGPLAFDLADEPERLLALAREVDAGTVFIDSLKDIASPLTDEKVGAAFNRAVQFLVADGREVCTLHHQRKPQADNKKPATLGDVYGSTWLTSGHGSVLLLWGNAGDPVVELIHLKQPGDEVGPLELVHDHTRGITRVHARPTISEVLADAGQAITVADAAIRLWGPGPTRNEIEKTRRKLEGAVKSGHAQKLEGEGPKSAARYAPVIDRDSPRDQTRSDHGPSRSPVDTEHAGITAHHAQAAAGATPLRGARDADRDADREATPEEEAEYHRLLSLVEDPAA